MNAENIIDVIRKLRCDALKNGLEPTRLYISHKNYLILEDWIRENFRLIPFKDNDPEEISNKIIQEKRFLGLNIIEQNLVDLEVV